MKKFVLLLFTLFLFSISNAEAFDFPQLYKLNIFKDDTRAVKSLLNSQVRYANKNNFDKFISTYDNNYQNSDGFNLETYSNLVKDIWNSYDNIKYEIKIKDIQIEGDTATVKLLENSSADIPLTKQMDGILKSSSNSIYYLKKINGKWKVTSDKVIDETTSMLYGDAINLDINLVAPKEVQPGVEYTASLEFTPPQGTLAIASIAKDKVEYPQKQVKEVFRKMPEDNLLERLFIANKDSTNEYVIASIGLTKADIQDLSIKIALAGFGYQIIRVNVVNPEGENAKTE